VVGGEGVSVGLVWWSELLGRGVGDEGWVMRMLGYGRREGQGGRESKGKKSAKYPCIIEFGLQANVGALVIVLCAQDLELFWF